MGSALNLCARRQIRILPGPPATIQGYAEIVVHAPSPVSPTKNCEIKEVEAVVYYMLGTKISLALGRLLSVPMEERRPCK